MTFHLPVLAKPLLEGLVGPFQDPELAQKPQWLVDCTLGGGGHCAAFLEYFSSRPELSHHRILALDQDEDAIRRAKERFRAEIDQGRLELAHVHFGAAETLVRDRPVLGLIADLGYSTDQLEDAQRGLSFQTDGPLDMRLDPTQGEPCIELLKGISEKELEKILQDFGEERFARRIASAIIHHREKGQLPRSTKELVNIVIRALPPFARHGRIHAATKTFQALRIAVNHELDELNDLLNHVILGVRPRGRIGMITFHSLEDRAVKNRFKDKENFFVLTKKPIQPNLSEIQSNPRARSAKLRIAEIVKNAERAE